MKKFLMTCAMTALATGLISACADNDEADDDTPGGGKGGTAGASGSSGKAGASSGGAAGSGGSAAGGKGGRAGSGGAAGSSAGRAGAGNGGGGSGSGGAGRGGTEAGGEGGLGGEAGESGQGGLGGEAGFGGEAGGSGQGGAGAGGEGGTPAPLGGQGGDGGTPAAGQGGAGGEGPTVPVALLRLNELNPSIGGGADLIELRVIQAGNIEGIIIQQSAGTASTVATLPALTVAADDLVVVHLNPANGVQAITNETTSKGQCTSNACFDAAWDVRGASPANGLAVGNRVISVRSGTTLQDAVPFVVDGGSVAGFLTELQAIQQAGQWTPAGCGGEECTYVSDPTALEVSVNWSDTETTAAGDSVQVTASNNNQAGAWDLAASTFGEPNE